MELDQTHIDRLVADVRDFARSRAKDVARGAETPRLAATLLQKYGAGVVSAVKHITDGARAADPVQRALDEETRKIDPDWQETDRARWAARPADLSFGS